LRTPQGAEPLPTTSGSLQWSPHYWGDSLEQSKRRATSGSPDFPSERQRARRGGGRGVSPRPRKYPGGIARFSQKSRKYRAPTMKIQEVLLASLESPAGMPPTPLVFELLVRGVFDSHEGRSYCVAHRKFQEKKKPPRERQINLGGFGLGGLGDYRLCEVCVTLPYSKCFSHEFER
jgi:hypothetical protein